jgi:hypothetical protein
MPNNTINPVIILAEIRGILAEIRVSSLPEKGKSWGTSTLEQYRRRTERPKQTLQICTMAEVVMETASLKCWIVWL